MTEQPTPAGWRTFAPRWPEPWTATHDDYDASYEGPEDGWVSNGLMATGNTREELLAEIAEIEAEHPHFADKRTDAESE